MDRSITGSCRVLFLLAWIGLEAPALAQAISPPRGARIPVVRRIPAEHATIQGAIDGARDGDVVLVFSRANAG